MTEERTWTWTGASRRHRVTFRHNLITGGQSLDLDGVVVHEVKWQYKLTGCLLFTCDESTLELYIRSVDGGNMEYKLTKDAKEIPLCEERQVSTWVLALGDGFHQVEFEHKSFDVIVDGAKVEAVGDFLEEGSCYHFGIGPSNVPAALTVLPPKTKRGRVVTTLQVDKSSIRQSELLGIDDEGHEPTPASGEGGDRFEPASPVVVPPPPK